LATVHLKGAEDGYHIEVIVAGIEVNAKITYLGK
jgi:hypothetical protein